MLKLVKKHERNKRMYSITSDAKIFLNEMNFNTDSISKNSSSTEKAKQIKTQAKPKNINKLKKEGLKDNPLHGKCHNVNDPNVMTLT